MSDYQTALRLWGAERLKERYGDRIDGKIEDITVEFEFREGFECCGGRDPDCYCSLAESPSANVIIRSGYTYNRYIDMEDFDFVTTLQEIIAAGGGTITDG